MLRLLLSGLAFYVAICGALWPQPRVLQTGSSPLRLSADFDVTVNVASPPADLQSAVSNAKQLLQNDKLQRLVVGRGAADQAAIQASSEVSQLILTLTDGVPVNPIAQEAVVDIAHRKEEYILNVPSDGSPARLSANSTLGLLRGLTTFGQMWYDLAGTTYTINTPVSIVDHPAFPYRGFMLDTARNFFPVTDIKATLDAMSWVKINTLHWHVVDSQSFPLEVEAFPELSQKASYGPEYVYSAQDVQDIVQYAAERGIDVLVEIDTPGHTAAIYESHPDFIACPYATPWSTFANEPPAGQLRFMDPAVANFTSALFHSVASQFPSKLFSTGGDELNTNCYDQDPEAQEILNNTGKTLEQALDEFTQQTHGTLRELGKTPVVWEEMVLDHNVTLSNDTIALVWISSQNVGSVAAKGFRLVHAASDYFYLDCGAGEWLGNDIDAVSWCDPFKSWQKAYSFDPLAGVASDQNDLVLGGQQLLWTEQSDPSNIGPIVWPRAAVTAEIFWTGATLPSGSSRNVTEALPRLHDLRFRLVQRGIKAIPLQPLWCALRPGDCDNV